MSQENVEIARKAIEAWNAGDMDGLRDLYDPNAVYAGPSDWIDAGPYLGREAVMQQFAVLRDVFRDSSFDTVDVLDAGERVVVEVAFHGDTRGLPLSAGFVWVYSFREGLITRLEFFHSKAEALAAVSASEQERP
jgi:ketosteroid isomerase-like protein